MSKYNYGIISTATITPRFIQAIQSNGDDQVYAIASRSLQKAKEFADAYQIPHAYDSYDEIYENEEIDIVYIALPNEFHYEEAQKALFHHKHVIIEKPITLNGEDTLDLFALAKENQCFLMEAQKSVFLPANQRLKEIINTKELGDLKQVQMLSSFPAPKDPNHWMLSEYGGVVYGSASYTIEYLMYLLNNPTMEASAIGIIGEQGAIQDVSINFKINAALLVNSHITMNVQTDNQATFYFEHGSVCVPSYWKARQLEIRKENECNLIEEFPCELEMQYEVAHIHKCLDEKRIQSDVMSAERSILCTMMVDQIIEQVYGEFEEDEEED